MSRKAPSVLKPQYLTGKITKDELIKRLKTLSDVLRDYEQDASPTALDAVSKALASSSMIRHRDKEVKVLAACCLSDIMRIYAPEAPYDDSTLINVFTFFVSQLRGLESPSGPYFSRYFYLLERLALVKAFIVITGFDTDELIVDLFTMLFDIVSDEHSSKVVSLMVDVMQSVVEEAETTSQSLLDRIMGPLLPEAKQDNEAAYKMSLKLIGKCTNRLEPFITQFLNTVLAGRSSESELSAHAYHIIFELNQVSPTLLLNVLPNLAQDLHVEESDKRMEAVKLLGRLFASKGSRLGTSYTELFDEFTGRFADKDQDIRLTMVAFAKHFLQNHPELSEKVTAALLSHVQDTDDRMRKAVVTCVADAAMANPHAVSVKLLEAIGHRTRDKKIAIRREAVTKLAQLYRVARGKKTGWSQEDTSKFGNIPNILMHSFYMPDGQIESRLKLDRIIDEQILPDSLDTDIRGRALLDAYQHFDAQARQAFGHLVLEKQKFQRTLSDWVAVRKNPSDSETIASKVTTIVSMVGEVGGKGPSGAESMVKLSAIKDNRVFFYIGQMCKAVGSKNPIIEFIKNVTTKLSTAAMCLEMMPVIMEEIENAYSDGRLERALAGLDLLQDITGGFPEYLGTLYPHLGKLLDTEDPLRSTDTGTAVLKVLANTRNAREEPLRYNDRSYLTGSAGLLGKFRKILTSLCTNGTPQQAKLAVDCIVHIFGVVEGEPVKKTKKVKDADLTCSLILDELLSKAVPKMNKLDTDKLATVLKTIGQIALRDTDAFMKVAGDVVPFLVKDVLARADDEPMDEASELIAEQERLIKITAIEALVKYLLPLSEDLRATAAPPVFRLLVRLIQDNGKLVPSHTPSPSTAVALKLAAAKGLLKLCIQTPYERMLSPDQYLVLALTAHDESQDVRAGVLAKLSKFSRDVKFSLRLGAVLALYGSDPVYDHVSKARTAMGLFFKTRRDILTKAGPSVTPQAQVVVMPEYSLPYLVHTLAHHPGFAQDITKSGQSETVRILSLFFSELLKLGNNVVFTSHLIDTMKTTRDPLDKTSTNTQVICDMCSAVLKHKTQDKKYADAGSFPGEVRLPSSLFAYATDAQTLATTSYLPPEFKLSGSTAVRESMSPKKTPPRKRTPKKAASQSRLATTHDMDDPVIGKARKQPKRKAAVTPKSKTVLTDDMFEDSESESSLKRVRV